MLTEFMIQLLHSKEQKKEELPTIVPTFICVLWTNTTVGDEDLSDHREVLFPSFFLRMGVFFPSLGEVIKREGIQTHDN